MQLDADLVRKSRIDRYHVLDQLPPGDLQAVVDLTAQVCGVPSAAINLITVSRQHQVAAAGFEASVCAREDSMCAAVLEEPTLAVVDASRDERFADNPFVTGEIGDVRFYASAPLVTPDGLTVGRLCVFDEEPRTMTRTEMKALEVLAHHVTDLLELRLRTRQLESSLGELTRTRDELRKSNESLAAFAGQVSHDLLNPLTAVLANAELLSGEPAVASDPELASLSAEVMDAGLRMAAMIENVLAHAQLAGRLNLVDTDLEVLIANVLIDLGPKLRESSAHVTVGPMPIVRADAGQIYLVLLNLVDNAVKYSVDGPPDITVGCRSDQHRWRVWVRDVGVGIAADRHAEVFLPHVRIHDVRFATIDGAGIGLDTVRRIIDAHGGRLGIESSPGDGTTVWFEIPHTTEISGMPSGDSG